MTFTFEKERMTAIGSDGVPMGHITFPRIRSDLVNISSVVSYPDFRNRNVEERMMETLLDHLTQQNRKAALTAPFAQQYVSRNRQWSHILPGKMHFTAH